MTITDQKYYYKRSRLLFWIYFTSIASISILTPVLRAFGLDLQELMGFALSLLALATFFMPPVGLLFAILSLRQKDIKMSYRILFLCLHILFTCVIIAIIITFVSDIRGAMA